MHNDSGNKVIQNTRQQHNKFNDNVTERERERMRERERERQRKKCKTEETEVQRFMHDKIV